MSNKNLTFAVIGKGTCKELENYGIFAEYMPQEYSAGALGRLLAEKLHRETVLYLFRAKKASRDILDELAGKVTVHDIPTYCTVYAQKSPVTEKIAQAFENGEIDYVTFTSASTVKGFVSSLPNVDFRRINALCIGEKTAAEAEKYHMDISVAEEATMDSMIDLLLNERNVTI